MLIENTSKYLLKKTRAKSKMFEYDVPSSEHISVEPNAIEILLIAIGVIGNISNQLWDANSMTLKVSEDSKKGLEFSSLFFDALFQSKIEESNRDYYILLGAIAYYFCDKIGSSSVLANELDDGINFDSASIDRVIFAMLSDKVKDLNVDELDEKYRSELSKIINIYNSFFDCMVEVDFSTFNSFKNRLYSEGSPRELLLGDALLAIFKKKIINSALNLMPQFSNTDKETWSEHLINQTHLKELWVAQLHFGEAGIFNGESGIVQMPTSSGKTTSVALTIQSAFLTNRTTSAVIVAPFRALCKEIHFDLVQYFKNESDIIINELSDIPDKNDLFNVFDLGQDSQRQITILTPEKLIYLLRHDKTILEKMGLVIFDEAHLFDDSSRGANYELLLSTIKYYIEKSKNEIQKILISAVMSNADEINRWFNGEKGIVIADNTIKSAEKTVSFSDWDNNKDAGYLYFINPENPNELEFYVPRTIEIFNLSRLKGENRNKKRLFPELNARDMGIYYTTKLNHNGAVAIYCGTKVAANKTLARFLDIENRDYDITSLKAHSKNNENHKVARLIYENYGENNDYYKTAQRGIFIHHSGISNGIRNSVEFAMKEDLVRCVVCTSTLAQGVNLPIKYLIVSSAYQAGERIKVRDFHNLIGRTGRAGKHTEGSVILAEPNVYLTKDWRFNKYVDLLNINNAEDCVSNILKIIQPFSFYDNKMKQLYHFPLEEFLMAKYSSHENDKTILAEFREILRIQYNDGLVKFEKSIFTLIETLTAIENYVLDFNSSLEVLDMESIILHTFGYYLANDSEKVKIRKIFTLIEEYLNSNVTLKDIPIFSKSQLGIDRSAKLKEWVEDNINSLLSCVNDTEILKLVAEELINYSDNKILKKIIRKSEIANLAIQWINGDSYKSIYNYCLMHDIQIQDKRKKAQQRTMKLEEIIEICDNDFGYSAILVIHAIGELILSSNPDDEKTVDIINNLCQRMRYGLSNKQNIIIYELGFSDRVIVEKISRKIGKFEFLSKNKMKKILRLRKEELKEELSSFPEYFIEILKKI
ncbi:DEAD/DEAH box helicase [Listeria monocytogenes]|nr:DEAD/DEAH box helicase [Listeria monocytogenes]EAE6395481.1 DEAD/DEAH box helicase [Listeria monocytogenes]EAE6532777.1 DEAD/DEAH box helicase [Listeria monocytogenes]